MSLEGVDPDVDLEEATRFIRRLATEQGEVAVRCQPNAVRVVNKDRRDFATQVDLEIEHAIKAAIRARFPGHGLSGEETEDENPSSEYQWLIDPIDGTKYYAGQSSLYSVSIGLLLRGEPVLGVVYSAASGQCFHAWKDGGAHLDGQRLEGSSCRELPSAIINVDTPGTDRLTEQERRWFESKLLLLTRGVYRVRALGQASLVACWMAGGAFDAYVDLTGYAQPQDLAAARVIMKESGARLEDLDVGFGPERLLAAPPETFRALRRLLLDE